MTDLVKVYFLHQSGYCKKCGLKPYYVGPYESRESADQYAAKISSRPTLNLLHDCYRFRSFAIEMYSVFINGVEYLAYPLNSFCCRRGSAGFYSSAKMESSY